MLRPPRNPGVPPAAAAVAVALRTAIPGEAKIAESGGERRSEEPGLLLAPGVGCGAADPGPPPGIGPGPGPGRETWDAEVAGCRKSVGGGSLPLDMALFSCDMVTFLFYFFCRS